MLEPQNDLSSPAPQSLSFEEAFTRLGEMVETLESGGLPLAQATELYEQGMGLVKRCSQLLDETELKIAEIKEGSLSPDSGNASNARPDSPNWEDMEMPEDVWEPDTE